MSARDRDGTDVYSPVYGGGLGHAYRSAVLLGSLRELGIRVVASSWGQGYRYLRSRGIATLEALGLDVAWGEEGKMRFKDSIKRLPLPFAGIYRQMAVEGSILDEVKPKVVLSDSRLTPLLAAARRNLPALLLINQVRLMAPHSLGALRRALELPAAELLGLLWSSASVVLVPDLPPPYTIAEEQLRHVLPVSGKLRFIGPIVRGEEGDGCSSPEVPRGPGGLALFTISGPDETKRPVAMKSAAAARLLARAGWTSVISYGMAGGDSRLRRLADGVYTCEWCRCIDQYIREADVVISRSGHATVGKLAYYGKPSVLMPIPFHGEQESNALKAERLGFAVAMLRIDLASASEIAATVMEVGRDDRFASNAARLSKVAHSMDPISITLETIMRYV